MPDEPTYREVQDGAMTLYTCLIPDAGAPDGICGHKTSDAGLMTQHMQQRHAGIMVKEGEESGGTTAVQDEALSPSADTAATPPEAQPTTAPQETPEEPV